MARSFEPRPVGVDAWKEWHRGAWRLLVQMGFAWLAIWTVALPLGILLLQRMGVGLAAIFALPVLGVLVQPVLQRALDQAATGGPVCVSKTCRLASLDLRSQWKWFAFRASAAMALMFMALLFIGLMGMWSAASGANALPSSRFPEGVLNPVVNSLVYLIVVPALSSMNGFLSFDYWLRVRHGADGPQSLMLQWANRRANGRCMFLAFVSLAVLFGVAVSWPLAAVALLPVLQWYHAAFVRCAYHDIFEDGMGIEEPAFPTQNVPAMALPA